MPQIQTDSFGLLDYAEDAVLEFPVGLPAFEDQTRFVLIERPHLAPLVFLQSLRLPDLAFLTLPVQAVDAAYRLQIPVEDRELLGFSADQPAPALGRELLCLVVVTVPPDGPSTVNLMAPVIINLATRHGAQVLQPEAGYSHQHPLFQAAEEQPCS
jgi:flagellar assembly factor FliW